VLFGPDGNIVVADCDGRRLCVFSPDGRTLLETLHSDGTQYGKLKSPKALAVAGPYLFVLGKEVVYLLRYEFTD
jgi:hypothetical protein